MGEFNFSLVGRVWINSEGTPFAGKGKIQLLEKIKEFGKTPNSFSYIYDIITL